MEQRSLRRGGSTLWRTGSRAVLNAAFADQDNFARRLDRLRSRGVAVGWGTLLVGLHGFDWVDRQASAANVIAIALDALACSPDDELVLALACLQENETVDVVRALERLTERGGVDHELERRKWRLLLLEERMEALPADPLRALLDLDEFWGILDHPEDGPSTARITRSGVPAEEYHARDNYEAELARHKRWMEREARLLRQADVAESEGVRPDVS